MKLVSLKKVEKQMREATTYEEWKKLALEHDEKSGMAQWKDEEASSLYDYKSIRKRLYGLRKLRQTNDIHGLVFRLNEGIHGNMGGMGKPVLYAKAKAGTKRLICEYIDEIVDALEHIAHTSDTIIPFEEKLDFFRRASHCFGRSALMLSGGAALGNFHIGVSKTLVDQDLLPNIISGSSAGAVVASALGTLNHSELEKVFSAKNIMKEAHKEANWFNRLLFGSNRYLVKDLEDTLERLIPDLTFQEAYEKTGRHINITVAPAELHQTSRLLNAMTSPNVFVRKAVMASCAIPGIFPPVTLEAKNAHGHRQPYLPSRKWVDGSVKEDLPAKRLARLYGVNHYIASQTNPLVLMFISDPKIDHSLTATAMRMGVRTLKDTARMLSDFTNRSFAHWPRFNLLMNMYASVVTQNYTADINIFPGYRLFDPTKLLVHLSEEELLTIIREGERASWPKVEVIRTCSKISKTLDRLLDSLDDQSIHQRALQHHKKSAAKRRRVEEALDS